MIKKIRNIIPIILLILYSILVKYNLLDKLLYKIIFLSLIILVGLSIYFLKWKENTSTIKDKYKKLYIMLFFMIISLSITIYSFLKFNLI